MFMSLLFYKHYSFITAVLCQTQAAIYGRALFLVWLVNLSILFLAVQKPSPFSFSTSYITSVSQCICFPLLFPISMHQNNALQIAALWAGTQLEFCSFFNYLRLCFYTITL